MSANVFTIPAGTSFADALARGMAARFGKDGDRLALSRATIYLPTRRAMRTVADAFARALGGAALLPDIRALGDVDEDGFLFDPAAADLDLPPPIDPLRQRLLLATLIQRWDEHARGGTLNFAQAVALARGLADFLAEAETQNADLSKLEELAPLALAEHWAQVRDFLKLIRDEWPALLEAEGAMNPAAHRNAALSALAERFVANPPQDPVIAAGSTGSIPATAHLLRVIAHLPKGAVILPGLDRSLDDESWTTLDPGHPQYGMKELLDVIGTAREDVGEWSGGVTGRARLLSEVLRPAPTTDAWRAIAEDGKSEIAESLDGLSLIEAAHPGEEACAIALLLREILETPEKTAALVTPDRNLARRVAAELARWNITVDDSAGVPLAHTPPGAFLCLLAEAADAGFAPVPLLALLKHPLAAGGMTPAAFRAKVRDLDRFCLRGPRPDPGLNGIAAMIARAKTTARDDETRAVIADVEPWFAQVVELLSPLVLDGPIAIGDAVARHITVAARLAATADEPGATQLWRGDAGESAASLLSAMSEASAGIPLIEANAYSALFREWTEEAAVRPAYGSHPRLAILGPLEARLQSFDLTVLGGLNEDSWPRPAATDAWLSRPMREKLGLEQPERMIGLAAHDFATLASAPRVVLTRAVKAEGAPTVASRWWQRLVQLTTGLGLKLRKDDATSLLAQMLDEPARREPPMKRPRPMPPVKRRPRRLSVTEIETWLRDPYAIYAKHVLRLKPLDPLDAEIGAPERGTAVHDALEHFLKKFPGALPADAEMQLIAEADRVFGEMAVPKAVRALWYPRFVRATHWFVSEERKRRETITRSHVEIRGTREFPGPAGPFELRARADRIDELRAGGATIIDYKTGEPPTKKQVTTLIAPQLPLEGAILAEGGFGIGKLNSAELLYIRFSGGAEPGEIRAVPGDIAALIKEAEEELVARIAEFDREDMPYVPRVMPFRADQPGDYDHLARVREWSLSGWEGDEE